MFKVTGQSAVDCEGWTRRNFVQAGVLGLDGLTLPQFLAGRAQASSKKNPAVEPARAETSVILMWMSGGPGHHETWDPKPEAVSQFRGPFGAISTSIPGVSFSERLSGKKRLVLRVHSMFWGIGSGSGEVSKCRRLHPEGITAISRGLSRAIPPVQMGQNGFASWRDASFGVRLRTPKVAGIPSGCEQPMAIPPGVSLRSTPG